MTIHDLLANPSYDKKAILEKLICEYCHLSKEQLFLQIDRELTSHEEKAILQGYYDYTVSKKPLEYILGYVAFANLRFGVTPATLIPRPETEYMIEAVREYLEHTPTDSHLLLDIGTGCGVLGLATLYHAGKHISQAVLTEISPEALTVAQKNYDGLSQDPGFSYGMKPMQFIISDILADKLVQNALQTETNTVLVANLPYIPEQLFDENVDETVKKREPKMAFVGGEDGLDWYRVMLDQLLALHPQGTVTGFLEMMTWQADILRKEYEKAFTFDEVKTFHFNIRILKMMTH